MSSLTWKRQPEFFKFDSRRHRCKGKPPTYDKPLAAKEITPDKRDDSANEKWSEKLSCCHKRIYLNSCAGHDSLPLIRTDQITACRVLHVKWFYTLINCIFNFQDISINAVGKRRQAYTTIPKGSMGRNHRNNKQRHVLHRICIISAFVSFI